MENIAALESFLGMIIKFLRLVREAGMPEGVYQKAIDDKEFRDWLVKACQEKLQTKVEPPKPSRISRLTKTFTVEVDKDDSANRVIPQKGGDVYYVDGALQPKHFQIRGKGKVKQTLRYLEFNWEPTTQEILDAIEEHCVRNPDLADTRAFHKANPGERLEAPVLSVCGEFGVRGGDRCVAGVCADGYGLNFVFGHLLHQWDRRIRVLVLCESE